MALRIPQTPFAAVCDLPHSPHMGLKVGCCSPRHSPARGPAAIYLRRHQEASWEHVAVAHSQAAIGEVVRFEDQQEPFHGDDRRDEGSRLQVRLYARELYSHPEIDVALGLSLLMVGDELVAYSRAEQLGPEEWALTGLWRGVRDTGEACGHHQPGERVLLLDSACLFLPYDPSEIGQLWALKAAAAGQQLSALPIAWEGRLTGASGVPMRPDIVDGQPRPRSRWVGTIGCCRAALPSSEPVVVWDASQGQVRQFGAAGPGRWASWVP
jgi:hypothetical protein